jgi:hypothetical protein
MTQDRKIQGNDELQRMVKQGREKTPPDTSFASHIPLQQFKVEREGSLPLQFEGYVIGQNLIEEVESRGTRVSIYVTKRGKIITHVYQWQRQDPVIWANAGNEGDPPIKRSRNAAAAHTESKAALAWLIEDGGRSLGSASREAWEMACESWPPLQGQAVEVVD